MHLSKNSLIISFLFVTSLAWAGTAQIKVIYGEDDRNDLVNETNAMYLKLAKSTAAMINPSKLKNHNNEQYKIAGNTLADNGICKVERFSSQPTAASCSGFLVDKNRLVTAGHCIRSASDCSNNVWVFDYKVTRSSDSSVIVDKQQVYKCSKIISQKLDRESEADYALIQLDRAVEDRAILSYRKSGGPKVGDSLVVIGHPSGLPTKVAAGANIRSVNNIFFSANLDTYGGNSGSAVFNASTGVVEGILVRGETDYVYDDELGCRVSNRLPNNGGDGEEVTRITIVAGLSTAKPPKPGVEIEGPVPVQEEEQEVEEVQPVGEVAESEETNQPSSSLNFWQQLLLLIFG